MRYYTFVLLLFICFNAHAQVLRGIITDNTTTKPLSPVTITNLNTKESTYNADDGHYTITAKSGDRIAFSYLGYKSVEEVAPAAIGTAVLNVQLVPTTYHLQQVNIYSKDLTQYQKDSLERYETYHLQLNYQHASALSPASFIAEKFSKKSQRLFKFQRAYPQLEKEHFIDTRYTPELVSELTGLTGDSIGHFMNAYPMAYDFSRAASDLEIKMWIKYNYKQYMRKLADSSATKKEEEH